MKEYELREKVVNFAFSYIGTEKGSIKHKEIVDGYNAHTPLARNYKVTYTDDWCATFISFVAIKCGLTDIIPTECSCSMMINLFKKMGTWVENDSYIPNMGDIIFYSWSDNGIGDNTKAPNHVGIVYDIVSNDIFVIEGNKSNKFGTSSVNTRTVKVNGRYIRGFGIPAYADMVKKMEGEEVITQEQFNAMFEIAMDAYMQKRSTMPVDSWAKDKVDEATKMRLTDGTRPHSFCTREEAVVMLMRIYDMLI